MTASRPYAGPVVLLTLEDARACLPHLLDQPGTEAAVAKIRTALGSDPAWRTPTR